MAETERRLPGCLPPYIAIKDGDSYMWYTCPNESSDTSDIPIGTYEARYTRTGQVIYNESGECAEVCELSYEQRH